MPPQPAYIDADCLVHFTFVNSLDILAGLFGGRIYIPDVVYTLEPPEICKPWQRKQIDPFIERGDFAVYNIMANTDEYALYLELQNDCNGRPVGPGEAAALALAETHNGILLSNNCSDVRRYAEGRNIPHLTTARILNEAYKKDIINIAQGTTIYDTLKRNSFRLPKNRATFQDFVDDPM